LLVSGIYAILGVLAYSDAPPFFLYSSILLIVVPTWVFPQYYFHVLFSRARNIQLSSIRQELLSVPIDQKQQSSRRMLLLLEEPRIERKKTWLIDIVTIVEILFVAFMHVLPVEILAVFFHI
jgi:amino acid transporter